MKTAFLTLAFLLLFNITGRADIIERVIYSGDTPLASTCKVTQTGPMELTAAACQWTTTGRARVVDVTEVVGNLANKALPTFVERLASGLQELDRRVTAGEIEYMPDGKRVRGWLKDKQGNVIERSRTRTLVPTALNITAGDIWVVYMVNGPGVTMDLVLQRWSDPKPADVLDYLLMPFAVPAGTTNLSGITIEVFTVKPGFTPTKSLFEK